MHFITVDEGNKLLDHKKLGQLPYPAAISFGNEINAHRSGRVRINSNTAVANCKDKTRLLSKLEASNVPVPTPFHPFSQFMTQSGFDYPGFDKTFTYPLVIRDESTSITITERTELLDFLKRRKSLKFTIYSIRMEEFHTARLTISPLLRKQTLILENNKRIEGGVIHVDLSGPQPRFMSAMIEESFKAALIADVDLGTVEMLYSETGEFVVSDISLMPSATPDPMLYARQLLAAKSLNGRHERRPY